MQQCRHPVHSRQRPGLLGGGTGHGHITAEQPEQLGTNASTSYTLSDVAKHDTAEECWAAIDGGVYDLTSWISRHPGGPDKIEPLCGTDATQKFRTQHDSQERPNNQLANFRIGDLTD